MSIDKILKEFSIFEKINLAIIEMYFVHEIYLLYAVELAKYRDDPYETKMAYVLSMLLVGFMAGIPAAVLYFHRRGHEMAWIRDRDDAQTNSMASKMVSNGMLLVCSVMTLVTLFKKYWH